MQTHLNLNQPFDTGSSVFPLYVWGTDEPYRPHPPHTHLLLVTLRPLEVTWMVNKNLRFKYRESGSHIVSHNR